MPDDHKTEPVNIANEMADHQELIVKPISINADVVSKEGRIRMVFVHPHLDCVLTETGFGLNADCRQVQEKVIRQSLDISQEQTRSESNQAPFLVFPELCIPFGMLAEIDEIIQATAWPTNSVVVGGLESVGITECARLLERSNNPDDCKGIWNIGSTFANLSITWIKASDGEVLKFVQPKLRPSGPEQARQGMYHGNFVLVYQTSGLSFLSLICFDCIAENHVTSSSEQILKALGEGAQAGQSVNLDLTLALQHNNNPEHPAFLEFARTILYGGGHKVNVADGAVAFINSAHSMHGRGHRRCHGRSGFYYRPVRWVAIPDDGPLEKVPETFALETPYASPPLKELVRARFREDGPCLHIFDYVVPSTVPPAAGAQKYPLDVATCYKILDDGKLEAGRQVPALWKVVFDWINEESTGSHVRFGCHSGLRTRIDELREQIRQQILTIEIDRLGEIVDLLLIGFPEPNARPKLNPDSWQNKHDWFDDAHGQALIELLSVSVILGLIDEVILSISTKAFAGTVGKMYFVVLHGSGESSALQLQKKYQAWLKRTPWGESAGKVGLLILSRLERGGPTGDIAELIRPEYFKPSRQDEQTIPTAIRSKGRSILKVETKVYWHTAESLRTVLDSNELGQAVRELRGKLGDADPAR